jgi:hypothetical protein
MVTASACVVCGDLLSGRKKVVCGKRQCITKRLVQSDAFARAQRAREARRPRTIRLCRSCGHRLYPGTNISDRTICVPCQRRAARWSVAQARLDKALSSSSLDPGIWSAGPCLICGTLFVGRRPRRTCSQACSLQRRLAAKAKRHGYRRQLIFVRDNWLCQICRVPVDQSVKPPHPLAPTVDHRIPLARGGPSDPSNLQTAHFICNSAKRDLLVAAPQPGLVGSGVIGGGGIPEPGWGVPRPLAYELAVSMKLRASLGVRDAG